MANRAPVKRVRLLRRILLTIAVTAAVVYGGAVVYLMTQETRLVFAAHRPLKPGSPSEPFEQIELTRADGERQFAWILRARTDSANAPWVLYCHGNAAPVASRVNVVRYEKLRGLGLNVFAPEYRGFGGLPGRLSEMSVTGDAQQGYRYLRETLGIPKERIVLYGWSLGSAVAVNLASEHPFAGVILEGAPSSLASIGLRRYPWMPIRLVMRNPFDSIGKVRKISAPMLFIHSGQDDVIPFDEGKRLFEAAPSPKQFVEVHGGHMETAEVDAARMFGAIRDFLHGIGVLPL